MRVTVRVPLKVILTGEHAVVHGYPAVAAALDAYVTVNAEPSGECFEVEVEDGFSCGGGVEAEISEDGRIESLRSEALHEELRYVAVAVRRAVEEFDARPSRLRIASDAPPACGLGTSAAVTAAVLLGLAAMRGVEVSRDELRRLVREVEVEVQGRASWTDATIVTYGGIVKVSDGEFEPIELDRDDLELVVVYSGKPSRTGHMVRRVLELAERLDVVDRIMELIGEVTESFEEALRDGNLERAGELMNVNHELLGAIGASTRELDEIVHLLRRSGALGAKVTGAGGGGCAVGLFDDRERVERAVGALNAVGYEAFTARPIPHGARIVDSES